MKLTKVERLMRKWGMRGVQVCAESGNCMGLDVFGCPCMNIIKWHVCATYLTFVNNPSKRRKKKIKAEGKTLLIALRNLQAKFSEIREANKNVK